MKTLTIALTLCFSALFASQAEAGPYRKNTEDHAVLIKNDGRKCTYYVHALYGRDYYAVSNVLPVGRSCYTEVWATSIGRGVNFRHPYADTISGGGYRVYGDENDPNRFKNGPRPTGPAGSGVIGLANIGKNNQPAPKNRQVKANYEANDAARLAAEAINGY